MRDFEKCLNCFGNQDYLIYSFNWTHSSFTNKCRQIFVLNSLKKLFDIPFRFDHSNPTMFKLGQSIKLFKVDLRIFRFLLPVIDKLYNLGGILSAIAFKSSSVTYWLPCRWIFSMFFMSIWRNRVLILHALGPRVVILLPRFLRYRCFKLDNFEIAFKISFVKNLASLTSRCSSFVQKLTFIKIWPIIGFS